MRRKDRQILDELEIAEIIEKADVCRVALADDNIPYLVTLNFGFEKNVKPPILYFHCAPEGKKIEIISRNSNVCFQFDIDHELIKAEDACGWGMNFRSVVGMGKAEIIKDYAEKVKGLNSIMRHYSGQDSFDYDTHHLEATVVLKVTVTELIGKKKGY